jgi:hypothetical protein
MSLHQQSFMELLSIADMQDRFPPQLTVIGVQPERLMDFGGSLTDCVRARSSRHWHSRSRNCAAGAMRRCGAVRRRASG